MPSDHLQLVLNDNTSADHRPESCSLYRTADEVATAGFVEIVSSDFRERASIETRKPNHQWDGTYSLLR